MKFRIPQPSQQQSQRSKGNPRGLSTFWTNFSLGVEDDEF